MHNKPILHTFALLGGALLLSLAGCASTPDDGGAARDDRRYTFTAEENYRAVYRKIIDHAQNCFGADAAGAELSVQGSIHADKRSAVIVLPMHSTVGTDTYQVIDVAATDDSTTRVVGYFTGSSARNANALQKWVLEDADSCWTEGR